MAQTLISALILNEVTRAPALIMLTHIYTPTLTEIRQTFLYKCGSLKFVQQSVLSASNYTHRSEPCF